MKATIVFSRNDQLMSRILRLFTGGLWSHCGVVHEENGSKKVTDAVMREGVQTVPYNSWLVSRKGKIAEEVTIEVPDLEAGMAWLNQTVGAGYDYGFFKSAFNPFRDKYVYADDAEKFRCNEFVLFFLKHCGLECFNNRHLLNQSSPESVYQALLVLNG